MTPVSLCSKNNYTKSTNSHKNKSEPRMNPPKSKAGRNQIDAGLRDIAAAFVAARQQAKALDKFPGTVPDDLETAYQIQDLAIDLWGQAIGGWKVGRIPLDLEEGFGIDRLTGPVFANLIFPSASGAVQDMPMFVGGFAAIEAEYVAVIARDAPADKQSWSLDEALEMISDLRIGVEIASSPLATINELGPAAVVSDFGNNYGLIVGPSIKDWRTRAIESMQSTSTINQLPVGHGGAFKLTGGFIRSVQFQLELSASRNRPMRAGDVIATGQTTGIHDIKVDQSGIADFAADGSLGVRMIAA